MSILTQSGLTTSPLFNKWNLWRTINSVTIFFSFFIPWIWGKEGGIYTFTGFRILDFYQSIGWFEVFVQDRELSERVRLALGFGQLVIGLHAMLIYCALNLFRIIFRSKLVNKPVWIMLVLCLIVLGIRSLWKIPFLDEGWEGLSITLWGYWLALIGLVSSTILEIGYYISKRD